MPLDHNFGCEDTPKWLNMRLEHKFSCANALHGPLSDFPQRGGTQNQNSHHTSIFEAHGASTGPKRHLEHNFGCDDSPKMLNMPLSIKLLKSILTSWPPL
jgi:hypothetical protein